MMMRRVAATTLVPPWLEPLLQARFFATCALHPHAARSECNMFCIDCTAAAFCFYCRSERHSGHRVVQIRRSSYNDVVRVSEVQDVLDISGVQTYVINSARVLFLNERPQPRGSGTKSHGHGSPAGASSSAYICEICARSLLDSYRFCSLGCKLVGIRRNGDATFIVDDGDDDDQGSGVGIGSSSSAAAAAAEYTAKRTEGLRGRAGGGGGSPNSRRRKRIPHRAPFAS